jgi:hypothetical protein
MSLTVQHELAQDTVAFLSQMDWIDEHRLQIHRVEILLKVERLPAMARGYIAAESGDSGIPRHIVPVVTTDPEVSGLSTSGMRMKRTCLATSGSSDFSRSPREPVVETCNFDRSVCSPRGRLETQIIYFSVPVSATHYVL